MNKNKQKFPLPVVGAFILNQRDEIFLVNSYKWKGYLSVPGGKIQLGEAMENALIREIKEEVGLEVKIITFLCPANAIYPKEFYKPMHFVFLDFLCRTGKNDIPVLDGKEMQGYEWFGIKDALKKNLEPYTRNTIENYIIPYMRGNKK